MTQIKVMALKLDFQSGFKHGDTDFEMEDVAKAIFHIYYVAFQKYIYISIMSILMRIQY